MELLCGEWDMRATGGSKEPQMEANILGGLNSFDIEGLMVFFVRGTQAKHFTRVLGVCCFGGVLHRGPIDAQD